VADAFVVLDTRTTKEGRLRIVNRVFSVPHFQGTTDRRKPGKVVMFSVRDEDAVG
jgi:hypothetical protein